MLRTVVLDFHRQREMHKDNASPLIVAMAEKCRCMLKEWDMYHPRLPKALQQEHLVWMCNKIDTHSKTGAPPGCIVGLDSFTSACNLT